MVITICMAVSLVTFTIPASIQAEHREIHAALERATRATGDVGVAARELARVLHPHFLREEEIALPPLGLLAPLARNEKPAGMSEVLAMTDALTREMPKMLDEHKEIRAAVSKLRAAAVAAHAHEYVELADKLALHAQTEEEVLYPAAMLVGELVRGRQQTR